MQEMYTICETPLFTKYCLVYWTQEEYEEFKTFLALNPEAGDVEPNTGVSPRIDHICLGKWWQSNFHNHSSTF